MTIAIDHFGDRSQAVWMRRLTNIQRRLRRAEDCLERAASDFDLILADVHEGVAPSSMQHVRRASSSLPVPFATAFTAAGSGAVAFVVHGCTFRVRVSPLRMDVLTVLALPTKANADDVVGFKTMGTLARSLRARGWDATGRSVTVEISRLRDALGPTNRHLIESRRGVGYRFRLLRSVVTTSRGDAV
jgi:hypothetical protein